MSKTDPYRGRWRIVEMEMWSQDFVDMEVEGFFLFDKDNLGLFQFGLVQGRIDYRIEVIGEVKRLEFSWEGQDDSDVRSGRGWAVVNDDCMEGQFLLHLGDESWFRAKKVN